LIDGWKESRPCRRLRCRPAEAAVFGQRQGRQALCHYQERLKILNAADFGDLLLEDIRLFREHPVCSGQYQNRFKFILVDDIRTPTSRSICAAVLSQAPSS